MASKNLFLAHLIRVGRFRESVQQKCMNQNQVPTCKSYGSDSSCPLDRCQVIQGICWDQGSSPTCTNFCAPDQCTNAGGCKWDDSTYSCSPCPNGACSTLQNCSTYTSSVSCPSSRCYWTIDDAAQSGTAGFCGPLECVEVTTAALVCRSLAWYSAAQRRNTCTDRVRPTVRGKIWLRVEPGFSDLLD